MQHSQPETKFIAVCAESRNLPVTAKNREILHIPRNFSFTATNHEFSIMFASLFRDICIIITCATVFQVSLNSSHAIRPVVMNIRPDVTI